MDLHICLHLSLFMYLPHLQCHAATRFSAHLAAFMVHGADKLIGVASIIFQKDERVGKWQRYVLYLIFHLLKKCSG